MVSKIRVIFDNDGIESRHGTKKIFIRLTDISVMEDINGSSATRIVLNNGKSYLVNDYADALIFDTADKSKQASVISSSPLNPAVTDLHMFDLIQEERQPQSWLGRMFADAAQIIKGDSDPLPPIRVTHDLKGRKLTGAELRKIYPGTGEYIDSDFIASRPDLAP